MSRLRLCMAPVFAGLLAVTCPPVAAQANRASSPSPDTTSQTAARAGVQMDAPLPATPGQSAASPATSPTSSGSAAKANARFQLALANADRLIDLAQQLKTEMDKTNQYMVSLNSIRRAQDIEKVAKELQKQLQQAKK